MAGIREYRLLDSRRWSLGHLVEGTEPPRWRWSCNAVPTDWRPDESATCAVVEAGYAVLPGPWLFDRDGLYLRVAVRLYCGLPRLRNLAPHRDWGPSSRRSQLGSLTFNTADLRCGFEVESCAHTEISESLDPHEALSRYRGCKKAEGGWRAEWRHRLFRVAVTHNYDVMALGRGLSPAMLRADEPAPEMYQIGLQALQARLFRLDVGCALAAQLTRLGLPPDVLHGAAEHNWEPGTSAPLPEDFEDQDEE